MENYKTIIKNTITFKVRHDKSSNEGQPVRPRWEVIEWHSFDHRHLCEPETRTQDDVDAGKCMGGPTVACFFEEHMAIEYADIKNSQAANGCLVSYYDAPKFS